MKSGRGIIRRRYRTVSEKSFPSRIFVNGSFDIYNSPQDAFEEGYPNQKGQVLVAEYELVRAFHVRKRVEYETDIEELNQKGERTRHANSTEKNT